MGLGIQRGYKAYNIALGEQIIRGDNTVVL
jgi:hypothetical protein